VANVSAALAAIDVRDESLLNGMMASYGKAMDRGKKDLPRSFHFGIDFNKFTISNGTCADWR